MKNLRILGLFALAFLLGWLMPKSCSPDPSGDGAGDAVIPDDKKIRIESRSPGLEALDSLPYVGATYDPNHQERGVIEHDPERAYEGLNLYDSIRRGQALLLDMEGKPVHRWNYEMPRVTHAYVALQPDGDLLILIYEHRLVRIDRDSNVLWSYPARVHHDFSVDADGDIYLLTREARIVDAFHETKETLVDAITVLDADGVEKEELSLLELMHSSPHAYLLPSIRERHFPPDRPGALDVLHTNHVHVFDGSLAEVDPLFEAGNVMISMRSISSIAVFDWRKREVEWLWGPTNIAFQHHPTALENGNILLFDNGRSHSRVIEVDPRSYEIEWSYGPKEGFYSATRGGAQRLPNGNTLITESDKGYAFEVTPQGETVWKFANPEVNEKGEREIMWRMRRFAPDELPFLEEVAPQR